LLLALFLLDLAAGLVLFLPLVGRRDAGVKFYRLILLIAGGLIVAAAGAHALAHAGTLAIIDGALLAIGLVMWFVLRYPKRLVYRLTSLLLGASLLAATVWSWREATHSTLTWSIAGSLTSVALLGSVNLAMLLGHWYLVVRGMPIEPLKSLTIATLVAAVARIVVVVAALFAVRSEVLRPEMLFFLMRAGWGLLGPLLLFPMVWGTVKIRSTMAATGILYVDVVAVVIGEVLAGWLAAIAHLPL
jgi:hypothetical protein